MRHLIRDAIILCGTSLLRNAEVHLGRQLTGIQDLTDYVKAVSFKVASAELNLIEGLNIEPSQRVILVHTETPQGKLAAEAIRAAYHQRFTPKEHEVLLVSANGLGSDDPEIFVKAVRNLAMSLKEQISTSRNEGHEVYIGAVGGFKPMAMVAAIVAAETSTNLYYIRQDFADPVEIDLSTGPLSQP
ncbi:MAG: putative CRISPR-associated protein [Fimbriimonadaceae bacterium]|nr:MAG: putative CRISPR-associated protein [Fimbriimonadaceae bacterium]